jgi:peptidoglycan/xylan/chitin deacetylase (PgdA/CDA1 family)
MRTHLFTALVALVAALATLISSGTTPIAAAADASRFQLQVPVLYYHHVACPSPTAAEPDLWICPDQFAAQMSYLHDQGWTTITADQLADLVANRICPPSKEFVVTFDDADADQYTSAAPILENLGMRGTFFVTTGDQDTVFTPGHMTWDEIRDLVARGHAIGNHTETHLSLNKQSPDVINQQIEGAEVIIQTQLGYRPRTFAYPYGRYNALVIAQVASSGFDLAFTVHSGAKESNDDPYESKRIGVESTWSGADVLSQMAPVTDGCKPATPDLSVGLAAAGPFKGISIYATSPLKTQTVKRTGVRVGITYRYWLQIANQAQTAGQFSVVPTVAGTATMAISYRVNGVDVTTKMRAGTFVTPVLQPWSSMTVVVLVKPLKPSVAGQSLNDSLTAGSTADPSRVDVARIVASL